jgi:hypothetical protein
MTFVERQTGRKYQLVKIFVAKGTRAKYQEARTGRRYNLVKRYI